MEQEIITLNELFTQTTNAVLEFCKSVKSEVADNIRPVIKQGDMLRSATFKIEGCVDSLRGHIENRGVDSHFSYVYFVIVLKDVLCALCTLHNNGYDKASSLIDTCNNLIGQCKEVLVIEKSVMLGNKAEYNGNVIVLDDEKQITTALNNKLSTTHNRLYNDSEYIKGVLDCVFYLYEDLATLLDAVMKNAEASELAENYKVGLLLLEVSDQLLGIIERMIKRNSVPVSDTIESILTECIEVCKSSLDECYRLRGMLETVTE